MFSCGRNCLSHPAKKKAVASGLSLDRVPLFFLYPRWYQEHIKQLHQAARATRKHADTSQDQETATKYPYRDHEPPPQTSNVAQEPSQPGYQDPLASKGEHRAPDHGLKGHPGSYRSISRQIRRVRSTAPPVSPATVVESRLLRKVGGHGNWPRQMDQDAPGNLEDWQKHSRSIARCYRNTYGKKSADETQEGQRSRLRKLARKYKHAGIGSDWAVSLRYLAANMRDSIPLSGEPMELDRQTIFELTGSFKENVWTRDVRSGCEVHVLPSKESESRDRYTVLLRGEDRARELTKQYLLELQQNHPKPVRPPFDHQQGVSGVRYTLSQTKHHDRARRYDRAEDITRPEVWNIKSFADYVEDLVTMRVPRTIRQHLYKAHETHNRQVGSILERLFAEPEFRFHISTRALNYAFAFASKHTELATILDSLYETAKSSGLTLPIDSFNILIGHTLRLKKSSDFLDILRHMKAVNVVPNGGTWANLLAIVKPQDARRNILAHMHASELFDSRKTVDAIAEQLIRADFIDFARRDGGFEEFLEAMDDLLGNDWVSSRVMNQMLKVCAKSNEWRIADTVTTMGTQRQIRFKSTSLAYLFQLTQKRGYLREALDLLQSNVAMIVGWDESIVVPAIFMAAWREDFYNVCRVLWHYAATRGIISYAMQNIVTRSLINNIGLHNSLKQPLRENMAGKIIIGTDIDMDTAGFEEAFPLLSSKSQDQNPIHWLSQYTNDDGRRDEQLSLGYLIMHRHLVAWKQYEPLHRNYFFDLLQEAFDKDYCWKITNHLKTSRQKSILKNVIQIQLRPASDGQGYPLNRPTIVPRLLLTAPMGGQPAEPKHPAPDTSQNAVPKAPAVRTLSSTVPRRLSPVLKQASPWQNFASKFSHMTVVLHFLPGLSLQILDRRYSSTKASAHSAHHPSERDCPDRIQWLRLRSAFITWNTSDMQIRVIKMLDWERLQNAISTNGPITKNWLRFGRFSNLLNHIKESYTFLPKNLGEWESRYNGKTKYVIMPKLLDKFEDVTSLKYATARLAVRSRGIYLNLPKVESKSQNLGGWKRRIALQAENVRRLAKLIEPFYEEWKKKRNESGVVENRVVDYGEFLHGCEPGWRSLMEGVEVVNVSDARLVEGKEKVLEPSSSSSSSSRAGPDVLLRELQSPEREFGNSEIPWTRGRKGQRRGQGRFVRRC